MAARRPTQGAIERECAAGIEHIVKGGAGEVNHKRGRSWSRLIGNRPLRVAKGGASTGQDVTVEPRLFGDPLQGFDPVLLVPSQGVEGPSGAESATGSLDDGRISTL